MSARSGLRGAILLLLAGGLTVCGTGGAGPEIAVDLSACAAALAGSACANSFVRADGEERVACLQLQSSDQLGIYEYRLRPSERRLAPVGAIVELPAHAARDQSLRLELRVLRAGGFQCLEVAAQAPCERSPGCAFVLVKEGVRLDSAGASQVRFESDTGECDPICGAEGAEDAGPTANEGEGEGEAGDCDGPEQCDQRDNDCDGAVDEGFDGDGDGWATCDGDCDDTRWDVHPGAPAVCGDGVDQGCIDEAEVLDDSCEAGDQDADGYAAVTAGGQDCDDTDAGVRPGAQERCGDGIDQDCDGADSACAAGDTDGDGQVSAEQGGPDCDDSDPTIYQGAPERCGDSVDQDCDGGDTACGSSDGDGDGFARGEDCDDGDSQVHPGATERCDGVDDDCDGMVDEGNPLTLADGRSAPEGCYRGPRGTEGVGACQAGLRVCTRRGGSPELECVGDVAPIEESCVNPGVDDDCDGNTDNPPGLGGRCTTDGAGACAHGTVGCVGGALECVPDLNPASDEACDGIDRDCDGTRDADEFLEPWHTRSCFDGPGEAGVGQCRAGTQSCVGDGYAPCQAAVYAQDETCDGMDNDCDGLTDEGC